MPEEPSSERAGARHAVLLLPALCVPLVAAGLVLALGDGPYAAGNSPLASAPFRAYVFIAESVLLVLAAPLFGIVVCADLRERAAAANGVLVHARRIVVPIVLAATATACASALLLATAGEGITLLMSHAALWVAAVALAAIGAASAAHFDHPLDAAAASLGGAVLLAVAIFAAGPALEDAPAAVIDAALLASPVVGAAAAAGIDIFRTDVLYRVSPLAHIRFDYPAWSTIVPVYLTTAAAALAATALLLQRRARLFPVERISR